MPQDIFIFPVQIEVQPLPLFGKHLFDTSEIGIKLAVDKHSGIPVNMDPVDQFIDIAGCGISGRVQVIKFLETHQIFHPDDQFLPELVLRSKCGELTGVIEQIFAIFNLDPAEQRIRIGDMALAGIEQKFFDFAVKSFSFSGCPLYTQLSA